MSLVMLRYDERAPQVVSIFMEFAQASCKAQEFESLLKLNLQYSLALAGIFESVSASDDSARKHEVISMGQIYERLKPYLRDASLSSMIDRGVDTRNALVHQFFATRQAGLVLTAKESAGAIKWCRAATAEFTVICRKLEDRWAELAALLAADPDAAVPGMKARYDAIERGEWP